MNVRSNPSDPAHWAVKAGGPLAAALAALVWAATFAAAAAPAAGPRTEKDKGARPAGSAHETETETGAATLASRIMPLIEAHEGKVAVAVQPLFGSGGESFRYHADEVMPTASLIKFPVMIETYRQAASKKIDLDSMITLKKSDKVPGSGILTDHFSDGATFKLRDAVHLMIVYSDNTATNLVLDAIGLGATAQTMEKLGHPNTKIHSKVYLRRTSVFPERSKKYGLGSTTPDEMIQLCEAVYHKKVVSPAACEEMLKHMRACDDHDKFPKLLPPGTKIAFKTGSVSDARTAAGIIECPAGPVALCVMTNDNKDQRWAPDNAGNVLCAKIARAVYDHFGKPGKNGEEARNPSAKAPSQSDKAAK